eukprot:2796226-Amphidinium_carterae.1
MDFVHLMSEQSVSSNHQGQAPKPSPGLLKRLTWTQMRIRSHTSFVTSIACLSASLRGEVMTCVNLLRPYWNGSLDGLTGLAARLLLTDLRPVHVV